MVASYKPIPNSGLRLQDLKTTSAGDVPLLLDSREIYTREGPESAFDLVNNAGELRLPHQRTRQNGNAKSLHRNTRRIFSFVIRLTAAARAPVPDS